jgi:uncharacterized protein (DUF1778 family)
MPWNTDRPRRDRTLFVRLTAEEKVLYEAAAKAEERTLPDWVRLVLTKHAKSVLDRRPEQERGTRPLG